MARNTGAVQYAHTGGSFATPIGLVTGGTWYGPDNQPRKRTAIGGKGVYKAGQQLWSVEMTVQPVDSNCLIDKILRSSYPGGLPPVVPLEVGDDQKGVQASTWYIDEATIGMDVEGALELGLTLLTIQKPTLTGGGSSYSVGDNTHEDYDAGATLGGSAAAIQSIEWTIANNLILQYSLDSKAVGSKRYPDAVLAGPETVECAVTLAEDPGHDISGDSLPTTNCQLQTTNGTETVTVAGTNMSVGPISSDFTDNESAKEFDETLYLSDNSQDLSITII